MSAPVIRGGPAPQVTAVERDPEGWAIEWLLIDGAARELTDVAQVALFALATFTVERLTETVTRPGASFSDLSDLLLDMAVRAEACS